MKKRYYIILLVFILSILSISSFAEEDTNITILFTHDLHDNLDPADIMINGKVESRGGFSRLATAISKEREIDKDLILIDGGDYSMGTLFQTIFTTHSPSLRIMGELGYDATTFGNHEFDFRTEGLSQSIQAAVNSGDKLPEIIASNTKFPDELNDPLEKLQNSFKAYGVKDYLVLSRKDIKIGIIGLMGEDADSNAPMAEVKFTDIVEESKKLVNILKDKEKVDLIIAISHSGTDGKPGKTEDEILAKEVPEIDVIISGHSHTTLLEPIVINDTIIASSGNYGENLGIMNIGRDGTKWSLKEYNIRPIDDNYDKDPKIEKLIKGFKQDIEGLYLDRFDLKYDEVVAYSDFNFNSLSEIGKIQEEEPLGSLISDAYIYAVKKAEGDNYKNVDVAIVASGVIRDSFVKGDIMVKDVFKVSSLGVGKDQLAGYPLVDVYLNGRELKDAAEVDASIQPLMSAAQLYMSGIQYNFNPNRIFLNRITDIQLNTDSGLLELEDDKLYRVVANLYTGQMLDVVKDKSKGLLSIVPKDENGDPVLDFDNRIIYNNNEEIKEWLALNQYLQSFPKQNGIPHIPEYYSKKQGRKIVDNDKNIISILKNPNKISIAIILLPILVLIVIGLLIRLIIQRKYRKRIKSMR